MQFNLNTCSFILHILLEAIFFIRPSEDGTYYGMVMSVCLGLPPSLRPSDSQSGSPSARFPHFSHTCFDILSWNFAFDFVLLYYRSSSRCRQFPSIFVGVMPLLELKILEIHSFLHFSFTYALSYRAEILHMTLFYCTTYQVWVSLICVNFCGSYAPFGM